MRKRALPISASLTNQLDLGTKVLNGRSLQYLSICETSACCKPTVLQSSPVDEKHAIILDCFVFVMTQNKIYKIYPVPACSITLQQKAVYNSAVYEE